MRESDFDEIVDSIGGIRLDSLLPSSPEFENTDYLFFEYRVLAELKILAIDQISAPTTREKASRMYARWLEKGAAKNIIFGTARLTTDEHSDEQRIEAGNLYRVPIERLFRKCERQIVDTKQKLNFSDFKGVCLIVNDRNTQVTVELFKWILSESQILENTPHIEAVLFWDRSREGRFEDRWLRATRDRTASPTTLALADRIRAACERVDLSGTSPK